VALGTVADVVKLDANNRRLVAQGLKRIRSGAMPRGLASLFAVAARNHQVATTFDLGFALGPRINAAGRLSDMTLGIECLLTDDPARADELARALDAINRDRRDIETGMRDQAMLIVDSLVDDSEEPPPAVCMFDPDFHEGVVGIVASRLKDKLHRPTFVFARGQDGLLKGSGRSIPGFHLRDALDLLAKRHPQLLKRFGGHAMAAGCTIAEADVRTFEQGLKDIAASLLDPALLRRQKLTDGPLDAAGFNAETVALLDQVVWGPGFETPVFSDVVEVLGQRLVGERHLKLNLKVGGQARDGIWFGRTEALPARAHLAFRLNLDEFQGRQRVQLVIEDAELPASATTVGLDGARTHR
jgi:single-stranded-DNA-specific exonuclease